MTGGVLSVRCERIFINEENSLFTHFECSFGSANRVWNASTIWRIRIGLWRWVRTKQWL